MNEKVPLRKIYGLEGMAIKVCCIVTYCGTQFHRRWWKRKFLATEPICAKFAKSKWKKERKAKDDKLTPKPNVSAGSV